MSEIAQGNIGPEAAYDIQFTGGSLVVTAKYGGKQAGVTVNSWISGPQLIEALKMHLTNQVEIEALDILEIAISKVP